jgi:cysteinyl-tRNA synthetase
VYGQSAPGHNALAAIFEFLSEINKLIDENNFSSKNSKEVLSAMQKFDSVLGLLEFKEKKEVLEKDLMDLIKKREKLRDEKKFKEADEITTQMWYFLIRKTL